MNGGSLLASLLNALASEIRQIIAVQAPLTQHCTTLIDGLPAKAEFRIGFIPIALWCIFAALRRSNSRKPNETG